MHIKFTRMKNIGERYEGDSVYVESKESVWIPVEDLKQAIVRQEEKHYRIIILKKFGGADNWKSVEVVKENPIELLEKYEKTQDARNVEIMNKLNKGLL